MIFSKKVESLPEITNPSYDAGLYLVDGNEDYQIKRNGILNWLDAPNSGNLVLNGDFSSDTGWIKGTGWTITDGKAVSTATSYLNTLSQTLGGLTLGSTYIVTFTIEVTSGSLSIFLGTNGNSFSELSDSALNQGGTYSFLHHKNTIESGKDIVFRASSNFTGTIDNVVIQEIKTTGGLLSPSVDQTLKQIVNSEGYELTEILRDEDGVVTEAGVVWPDGTQGAFTTLVKNEEFLTLDSYSVTYEGTPVKTITQPTVERDENGAVINKPLLTIT